MNISVDYVNAMFESLQSKKIRVDCSELFGLVKTRWPINCFCFVKQCFC